MACSCGKCKSTSKALTLRLSGEAKEAVEKMAADKKVSVQTIARRMIGTQVTINEITDRGGKILYRMPLSSDIMVLKFK